MIVLVSINPPRRAAPTRRFPIRILAGRLVRSLKLWKGFAAFVQHGQRKGA